jgi:hypothetical protein
MKRKAEAGSRKEGAREAVDDRRSGHHSNARRRAWLRSRTSRRERREREPERKGSGR